MHLAYCGTVNCTVMKINNVPGTYYLEYNGEVKGLKMIFLYALIFQNPFDDNSAKSGNGDEPEQLAGELFQLVAAADILRQLGLIH